MTHSGTENGTDNRSGRPPVGGDQDSAALFRFTFRLFFKTWRVSLATAFILAAIMATASKMMLSTFDSAVAVVLLSIVLNVLALAIFFTVWVLAAEEKVEVWRTSRSFAASLIAAIALLLSFTVISETLTSLFVLLFVQGLSLELSPLGAVLLGKTAIVLAHASLGPLLAGRIVAGKQLSIQRGAGVSLRQFPRYFVICAVLMVAASLVAGLISGAVGAVLGGMGLYSFWGQHLGMFWGLLVSTTLFLALSLGSFYQNFR